jgi:Tfp pilus assembly protein PilF
MNRTPHTANNRNVPFGTCVLLAVAVLVVFGPVLRHEFVNYDDDQYICSNPHVQAGLTWRGAIWAFRTGDTGNWHPLTWLSLMLDVDLFGSGPAGPHLTNVILHAANTVLLFVLWRRLTGAQWRSAFVAGLFALHPLHVESVAWASERKDVLSACFGLLALLMYARYVHAGDKPSASRDYWLALLCYALALMSKPMMVTLPFVMLLLDWWPLGRWEPTASRSRLSVLWRLVSEKLPHLALSVVSSAVTVMVQNKAIQPLTHITIGIRVVNAVVSYVRYLGKMFWPVNLAIPYPHTGYASFNLFCLSAMLIAAVCLVAIRFRREFPFLVTGWFWYLGMLVPVIGLVQVGMQSMADRYTYLPLIGVFIILAWGADEVRERWGVSATATWPMALLVLAACTARTMDQLRFWQNSETLFRHTLTVTKANYLAYYNLGEYYARQGRYDEAMENCRKALQISPHYSDALNNFGVVLALTGKPDEAVVQIREAIRYSVDKADAYYNLGNVFVMQRKFDEAADAYNEALRLKPDYAEAHNNLANVLATQGHRDAAVQHYREALRLNPAHEGAKRQLRALGALPPE